MSDDIRKDKGAHDNVDKGKFGRRDFLKGLATVPVLGVFFYKLYDKISYDNSRKDQILSELGFNKEAPAVITKSLKKSSNKIRIGIIGNGGRGESLIRSAGFAHPDWIEKKRKAAQENNLEKSLEIYLTQDDLNLELTAVCDVFDVRAERGIAASKNEVRPGGVSGQPNGAKRYLHYQDLLDSTDVDAVIIATPDHWHAQMSMDAIQAGKHVYSEKCMTRTESEALKMYEMIKNSTLKFQLGHQNRQQESYIKAKEIIDKGILGPITLVETTTNRNSPEGAWVYDIHEAGSPKTIDWDQFQGPAPHKVPFSLERFFRWRCWYDYGTGLSGDMLSHEYDAINQILNIGIPHSAVASGGIYYFKDGRDVPDVFQAVLEYPKRNLTMIYSSTLASNNYRMKQFMGHDATMQVSGNLSVQIDSESTQFKQKIENNLIDPNEPIFSYSPGGKGIDVVTSATERYFATRGLLYSFRDGRRVDVTTLHIKDWLDCIRNGGEPVCNIDRGFEEAITCHMATRSFLEGRKVYWDPLQRRIV